jgi:hypothetical protein
MWLCSGAFAHAAASIATTTTTTMMVVEDGVVKTTPNSYHIRRRLTQDTPVESTQQQQQQQQQRNRNLNDFVPSFSRDDESLAYAQMPQLTLVLGGLSGAILGEKSYDALETAMNDYLNKRFEEYFAPRYAFKSARSQVLDDTPFVGGNYVTMATSLAFLDPDYVPPGEEDFRLPRKRAFDSPTFRASDLYEDASSAGVAGELVPTEWELQEAAAYAWSDLTSFGNHLLVAATIENLETLSGIEAIDSLEDFPAAVVEQGQVAEETKGKDKDKEKPSDEKKKDDSSKKKPKDTPSLNVAAASSALTDSGTDRMNPLWPSLIVGLAVFLLTIIILGYRKHRSRDGSGNDHYSFFGRSRSMGGSYKKHKDNVLIHVNLNDDNSTMLGDEEIEVEDQLYSYTGTGTGTPSSTPDRKQLQKMKERDLDKEYATSCLKPGGLVRTSSTPPSSSADEEEDETNNNHTAHNYDGDGTDGEGRKNCLGRKRSKSKQATRLQEQDSMANQSSNNNLPRRVDLTATPDQSSWRNPANLRQEEGIYDNGDLTQTERKRFTKYMESGMSVAETSKQVLSERRPINWAPVAPSVTSQTRSGFFGGYSNPSTKNGGHRGSPGRAQQSSAQSNPMDCCATGTENAAAAAQDGTAVHYVQTPAPYMSLGAACSANDPNLLNGIQNRNSRGGSGNGSRRIDGTARAMVITEASSYASSYDYDDEEFDRAMEEAAAETAMA